ncbi:MAG: glutathione S-transferase N-terminal domain-containing protein [Pseudomonadota bacterium]
MELFATPNSPYARMPRIVTLEKGLGDRVTVILAQTREADSPYYQINPSGRVPYLITDDGIGLEDSALICAYLDQLDGKPMFGRRNDETEWRGRRLEALAHSLLAGLAVWTREGYRPENERSPGIIDHERERCRRLTEVWESEIDDPHMQGDLSMAQIVLICALQLEHTNTDIDWRPDRPRLVEWVDRLATHPSISATLATLDAHKAP